MKRFLALVLMLCLCAGMTGCSVRDYAKASKLYKNEEYAQALVLYQSLGDFADSEKMAEICMRKANYEAAEAYFAAGQYRQALPLYSGLGMYADSPVKAVRCQYEIGLQCITDGDYKQAISYLEPLGSYENSADQTNLARWLWLCQARHTYVIQNEGGSFQALSAEPTEDGSLRFYLEKKGMLLGLPYETEFSLTLVRNSDQAAYTIRYESASDTTVSETAAGAVELGNFSAGGYLQIETFRQSVTDAAGEEVTTEDVTQAIMIRSVLADAQAQVMEYLPLLLEKSGVEITVTDLGL